MMIVISVMMMMMMMNYSTAVDDVIRISRMIIELASFIPGKQEETSPSTRRGSPEWKDLDRGRAGESLRLDLGENRKVMMMMMIKSTEVVMVTVMITSTMMMMMMITSTMMVLARTLKKFVTLASFSIKFAIIEH